MDSEKGNKVILVTGSNKGLGYAIVKDLLNNNPNFTIILTSRDEELGKKALDTLTNEIKGAQDRLVYHQLDITNQDSIDKAVAFIKERFGKIDILVNNAGVYIKKQPFNYDTAKPTLDINVYGTINLTERVLSEDLIRPNGRIVILGSTMGQLNKLTNESIKAEFRDNENLSKEKLIELADRYLQTMQNNTAEQEGWPLDAYSVSKMIDNSYPKVLAKRKDIQDKNIAVYVCHPGWVKTDMGSQAAPLTIEEGIVTPLYLINLPDGIIPEYQGKYFDKSKVTSFEE